MAGRRMGKRRAAEVMRREIERKKRYGPRSAEAAERFCKVCGEVASYYDPASNTYACQAHCRMKRELSND
jgi:hypothetical protein